VLLVGAYERDNFGDLLFLLVTERYLAGAEVVAAAPFAGDMRALLGRRIPAYGPLLERERFDAIWTVGGQVGGVDLARAYRMSASPRAWRRFVAASEPRRARILRRATGGVPIASPYIPSASAFERNASALTVLNSVGLAAARGAEPVRRAAIVTALREAGAIAVRDPGSQRLLRELGIEHRLVPDAVHALGVLDPFERGPADTAIVQVSSARLRMLGHERVGAALARSPALRGRPIRLLLAGTARGHDAHGDAEAVARAARRSARGVDVAVLDERRPLALVDQIRRARVVVGTSLHVRVVAAAYGVPRVSLAKGKPTRYARRWDPDMPYEVGLADLDAAVEAALDRGRRPEAAAHATVLALAAHENLEAFGRLVLASSRLSRPS